MPTDFSRYEYWIVLLLTVAPTLLLAFHPRSSITGRIGQIFVAIMISAIPFLVWDVWATLRGHWSFSKEYTTGLTIGILPVEEILFFVVVPYACLYVWNVIRDFTTLQDLTRKILMK